MITKEAVLEAIKAGRQSQCIDQRDFSRLIDFFPVSDWHLFGFRLKEGEEAPEVKAWDEQDILACLHHDLQFAFEKAYGQRGISSSLMYEVIKMWMWVLDHPLQHDDNYAEYANYGLTYFIKVAHAFKWEVPEP